MTVYYRNIKLSLIIGNCYKENINYTDSSANIYDVTWFGCGEINNTINWGTIYSWYSSTTSASQNC